MTTTDATAFERDLVVNDAGVASALNAHGIAAWSFDDIIGSSDIRTMTLLSSSPTVLIVDRPSVGRAAVLVARLRRLGLRFMAVAELLDRRS